MKTGHTPYVHTVMESFHLEFEPGYEPTAEQVRLIQKQVREMLERSLVEVLGPPDEPRS